MPLGAVLAADKEPLPPDPNRAVRGQITVVKPSSNQFTVKTREGTEVQLQLLPSSKLQADGKPATFSQFKEGTHVRVFYEKAEGTNRVVAMTPMVTEGDLKKDVSDALDSVKAFTFQQKEKYKEILQDLLERLEDRIDDLQERAAKAKTESREELQAALKDLEAKKAELQKRMQKVASASADAWDELKKGMGSALDELQNAFQRAASKFK